MYLNLKDSIVESSRLNIYDEVSVYYIYIIVSISLHIKRIFYCVIMACLATPYF